MASYHQIIKSWFPHHYAILVFTNADLFQNQLTRIPLSTLWSEYRGGNDVKKAFNYIYSRFENSSNRHGTCKKYPIFVHSKDSSLVRKIVNSVNEIILEKSLFEKNML